MNLDQLCAKYGKNVANAMIGSKEDDAKKAENLITKALGVIQEQGLYAFALFCISRSSSEKKAAKQMKEKIELLLKSEKLKLIKVDLLNEFDDKNGIGSKLDDLLLAIELVEKTLIYARYFAKGNDPNNLKKSDNIGNK